MISAVFYRKEIPCETLPFKVNGHDLLLRLRWGHKDYRPLLKQP